MLACSRYRFKYWGRTANPYISLHSLIAQQQQQKPTGPKSYSQTGVTPNNGEKNRKRNNAFPKKQTKKTKKQKAHLLSGELATPPAVFTPRPLGIVAPNFNTTLLFVFYLRLTKFHCHRQALCLSRSHSLAFVFSAFPSSPYNMRKTKQ
jgi:hypothetical protein